MSQRIITGFFDKRSNATEAIDHLVEGNTTHEHQVDSG
jgi:hypothetical protein